jgi:hypothetical protein
MTGRDSSVFVFAPTILTLLRIRSPPRSIAPKDPQVKSKSKLLLYGTIISQYCPPRDEAVFESQFRVSLTLFILEFLFHFHLQ